MTKQGRKWLSSMLAVLVLLSLFLGLTPGITTVVAEEAAEQEATTPALASLMSQLGQHQDSDTLSFVVELKADASAGREDREYRSKLFRSSQEEFLQALNSKGIAYNLGYQYDLLFNGLQMNMTVAAAKDVAKMDQVGSINVDQTYQKCWDEPKFTPSMLNSSVQVNANFAWVNGYTGKGKIIAIIDTGCNPNHRDYVLNDEDMVAANLTEAEVANIVATGDVSPGQFFSNKIPFAYNYKDKNLAIDLGEGFEHGGHVAGIIGANGNPERGGVRGIAPLSQLLVMQVFNAQGYTSGSVYYKAMEDAVKLGASAINMSLGSPSGDITESSSVMNKRIAQAMAMGCLVVIANGNEGTISYPDLPNADNPETGMAGSPAVEPDSLAVASINNLLKTAGGGLQVEGTDTIIIGNFGSEVPIDSVANTPYEVVDCGLGQEADFTEDVTGKIALIQRGGNTFSEKVKNAAAHGAVFAIIYNNQEGSISMILEGTTIPSISITQADGDLLKSLIAQGHKVTIINEVISMPYDGAGEMSDFSSWGLASSGDLKPEITAPGGNIWSTIGDDYGNMSGTSMATPHMAGAVSLMAMRFDSASTADYKISMDMTPRERGVLIKNLLMSSAVPHIGNLDTGACTSPRQQGAGVLDLQRALQSYVTVTATSGIGTGYCKQLLGSVNSSDLNFTVQLSNYGPAPVTFESFEIVLSTDEVLNGKFTLRPRLLLKQSFGQGVTVPAATENAPGTTLVPVSVNGTDLAATHEDLIALMHNGYYLEGFVFFNSSTHPQISIPFVALREGEFAWDDLPILEKAIYEYQNIPQEIPQYYWLDAEFDPNNFNFTHFYSSIDGNDVVLGETSKVTDAHRSFVTGQDADPLYFSPNGDGKLDDVSVHTVFTRNFSSFTVTVVDAAGTVLDTIVSATDGHKNGTGFTDNNDMPIYSQTMGMPWKGLGLADGRYYLQLNGQPVSDPNSSEEPASQDLGRYCIVLDTKAPVIDREQSSYDQASGLLKLSVEDPGDGSGIDSVVVKVGNREFAVNEDGSCNLPAGTDPAQVTVILTDKAYNTATESLEDALTDPDTLLKAKLLVSGQDSQGNPVDIQYKLRRVRDGQATEISVAEDNRYVLGDYEVELIDWDQEQYKVVGQRLQTITLEEENGSYEVVFEFEKDTRVKADLFIYSSPDYDFYQGPRQFKIRNLDTGEIFDCIQDPGYPAFFDAHNIPYGHYEVIPVGIDEGWATIPSPLEFDHTEPDTEVDVFFSHESQQGSINVTSSSPDPDADQTVLQAISYDFIYALNEHFYSQADNGNLPYGAYLVMPHEVPEGYYVETIMQPAPVLSNDPVVLTFIYHPLTDETNGKVTIKVQNPDGSPSDLVFGQDFVAEITDAYGNEVADLTQVPYGTYFVDVVQAPPGYAVVPDTDNFILSAENQNEELTFTVQKLSDLYPDSATLLVTVQEPEDYDIRNPQLQVSATNTSGEKQTFDIYFGQGKGNFKYGNFPGDTYTIQLENVAPGYTVLPEQVVADAMYDPAKFTGRYLEADFVIVQGDPLTVTFVDSLNGTSDSLFVGSGETAHEPIVPRYDGKYFMGWYLNEDGSGAPYDFATPVTEDITLYAIWADPITVIFHYQQADLANFQTTVAPGMLLEEPAAPNLSGKYFEGWFADEEGNIPFDFTQTITEETNNPLNLYAQWSEALDVTFDYQAQDMANLTVQVKPNESVSKPAVPERTGYTFAGWFKDAEGTIPYDFAAPVTESFTLYAKWEAENFKVTIDLNDGSLPSTENKEAGSYSLPEAPEREGYAFVGWFDQATGQKLEDNYTLTKSLTIVAKWVKIHTVTFAYDDQVTPNLEVKVEDGQFVARPANPSKDGFYFEGWYTADGIKFDFSLPITDSLVLTAKWSEGYTVSFESNGGSPVEPIKAEPNKAVAEPEPPTREGFVFVGWYEDSELTIEFSFKKLITADKTLYAKWEESGSVKYTVTFDTQGGTEIEAVKVAENGMVAAPDPAPTKEGYNFAGWFKDAECTVAYDFTAPVTSDLTLYAKWEEVIIGQDALIVPFDQDKFLSPEKCINISYLPEGITLAGNISHTDNTVKLPIAINKYSGTYDWYIDVPEANEAVSVEINGRVFRVTDMPTFDEAKDALLDAITLTSLDGEAYTAEIADEDVNAMLDDLAALQAGEVKTGNIPCQVTTAASDADSPNLSQAQANWVELEEAGLFGPALSKAEDPAVEQAKAIELAKQAFASYPFVDLSAAEVSAEHLADGTGVRVIFTLQDSSKLVVTIPYAADSEANTIGLPTEESTTPDMFTEDDTTEPETSPETEATVPAVEEIDEGNPAPGADITDTDPTDAEVTDPTDTEDTDPADLGETEYPTVDPTEDIPAPTDNGNGNEETEPEESDENPQVNNSVKLDLGLFYTASELDLTVKYELEVIDAESLADATEDTSYEYNIPVILLGAISEPEPIEPPQPIEPAPTIKPTNPIQPTESPAPTVLPSSAVPNYQNSIEYVPGFAQTFQEVVTPVTEKSGDDSTLDQSQAGFVGPQLPDGQCVDGAQLPLAPSQDMIYQLPATGSVNSMPSILAGLGILLAGIFTKRKLGQ